MTLLIISFIAGVLTVLAPCILPLLPIIIGGSIEGAGQADNRRRTLVIVASLSVSLIVFTLLLKVSTLFVNVPPQFWSYVSAAIIFYFGTTLVFPSFWDKIPYMNNLSAKSNKMLNSGFKQKSMTGDIIMGAALGPVFSTCSPTYFLILATVLPVSFGLGLIYIFVYVFGLALSLFAISILGDKLVSRLGGVSDPKGYFKKTIGIIFILVAIFIATGYDKTIQQAVLNNGLFDVTKIESKLLNLNSTTETGKKFVEIQDNSQYLNSNVAPLIKNYVGKKIVMIDFLTYSCINCKRTFPYMNDWYNKYEKDGLVIIGIHTPEFAFEHNIDNVKKALDSEGIKFPIVLDNDYKTWNAWNNNSWPHKFLIDINGNVVYDHSGEGNYKETEAEIVKLINEKNTLMGLPQISVSNSMAEKTSYRAGQSQETYFGAARNYEFIDTAQGNCTSQNCNFPKYNINTVVNNKFALSGIWKANEEYTELNSDSGNVAFNFNSGNVYLVAAQDTNITPTSSVDVYVDGKFIKNVVINASNIYQVVEGSDNNNHKLELKVRGKGFQIYTYTFGESEPKNNMTNNTHTWNNFTQTEKVEKIKALSPLQEKVTQHEGTESPFNNEYNKNYEKGIYVDIVSGEPLFSSSDKYDSGTGWPSFVKPIETGDVIYKTDTFLGYGRTEVRSKIADSHLGHMFDDGPTDRGGKRYCMNSAALKFIALSDMQHMGYGDYVQFIK